MLSLRTSKLLICPPENLQILTDFGLDLQRDSDIDTLFGYLKDAVIARVTRMRHGEIYIILRNSCQQRILQILGDGNDFQISASTVSKIGSSQTSLP